MIAKILLQISITADLFIVDKGNRCRFNTVQFLEFIDLVARRQEVVINLISFAFKDGFGLEAVGTKMTWIAIR